MNHVPPVSITLKNYVHVKAALRISSETADLVTFTEEILNGKLHFLCIGNSAVLLNFKDGYNTGLH